MRQIIEVHISNEYQPGGNTGHATFKNITTSLLHPAFDKYPKRDENSGLSCEITEAN